MNEARVELDADDSGFSGGRLLPAVIFGVLALGLGFVLIRSYDVLWGQAIAYFGLEALVRQFNFGARGLMAAGTLWFYGLCCLMLWVGLIRRKSSF